MQYYTVLLCTSTLVDLQSAVVCRKSLTSKQNPRQLYWIHVVLNVIVCFLPTMSNDIGSLSPVVERPSRIPKVKHEISYQLFYIDLHFNDTQCGERSFVVEYISLLLYNPADVYCKGVKVYSLKTSSSYIIIVLCTQRFSSNSCVCAMHIQIIYIILKTNCSFLVHM